MHYAETVDHIEEVFNRAEDAIGAKDLEPLDDDLL
jgi:hypothetical protein